MTDDGSVWRHISHVTSDWLAAAADDDRVVLYKVMYVYYFSRCDPRHYTCLMAALKAIVRGYACGPVYSPGS